ncbi:hypothetical protein [Hymenobacter cellulosilyticus]|uniref:STAS/SEC14 domain-containing protein n=1 Tax=Hymenobacter cellulosilyticus TaxID=2932248 RepID=A0A8T9Q553_9BACT|nr:hypothetical protein [Hymenobacter cellulosilyticus]UOQ71561.1 hypothetical protein MUN79_23560 [Hymenobacter cellulosilyticus]
MHPLFDSPVLRIDYHQVHDWLYVTWKNEQNEQSVMEGCRQILSFQEQQHCGKLLMDSSQVSSMWEHAAEWGAQVWFPALQQTGLRYVAWVYSASFYSRMSFDLAIKDVKQPIVLTFDDTASAEHWLAHV